jgi:hypothetical protein
MLILIDTVANSQKGVIQPQIINPAQISEQGKGNQANMPSDLSSSIPMSATHQHVLLKMISIDVFLKGLFLVYVICLPLTNNVLYNLFHGLPLLIKIKGTYSKFTFIQPEHDYLLMDTVKWYFTRLGVDKINDSKTVRCILRVCKQTKPVQLTHLDEECEPRC